MQHLLRRHAIAAFGRIDAALATPTEVLVDQRGSGLFRRHLARGFGAAPRSPSRHASQQFAFEVTVEDANIAWVVVLPQ
jgi:hypothetical protein